MIARASVVVLLVALGCASSQTEATPAEPTRAPDPSPTISADVDVARLSASDLPPLPRDVVAVVNGVEISAKAFHAVYDPLIAKLLRGSPRLEERRRKRAAELAKREGREPPKEEPKTKVTVGEDRRARERALRAVVFDELLRQKARELGIPSDGDKKALEHAVLERMGALEVPREEIDKAFEAIRARPGWKQATVRVSMILVESKLKDRNAAAADASARAQAIYARATEPGADFAALARTESADPDAASNGGDLGVIIPGDFDSAIAGVAGLKVGDVAPPQQRNSREYVIFKLTGKWKPGQVPKAAVEPQIVEEILSDQERSAASGLAIDLFRAATIVDHIAPTLEVAPSTPSP